jgi:hypothetical protein
MDGPVGSVEGQVEDPEAAVPAKRFEVELELTDGVAREMNELCVSGDVEHLEQRSHALAVANEAAVPK